MSFEVTRGEFWCVLGRNGVGKTTLSRTLLGLWPAVGGRLLTGSTRLAYLPQRASFDELYPMSACDVVAMGAERGLSFLRARRRDELASVDRALAALELSEFAQHRYRDLSEGQKQRVLLARLGAARPELAFLDEPTSAMDARAEARAYDYLKVLCKEQGLGLFLVTHDFSVAKRYADRVLFIDDSSRSASVASPSELFQNQAFLRAHGLGDEP